MPILASDSYKRTLEIVDRLSIVDRSALQLLVAEHRAALELIEFQQQRLESLTLLDELTGLKNRRGFMILAEHHVRMADRTRRPLVLIFADLDGLKLINDTLGHAAGDEAIRCVGRALETSFRTTDIVSRFAGDELVVLAPECAPDAVDVIIGRVHDALEGLPNKPCPLRLSMGHVVYDPREEILSVEDLLSRADAAMYNQKRLKKKRAG